MQHSTLKQTILSSLVAALLGLSGCNQVSESASADTTNIKKPDLAGAALPENFPSDVPIMGELVLESSTNMGNGGFMVNGDVAGSKDAVAEQMFNVLSQEGWQDIDTANKDANETTLTAHNHLHKMQAHMVRESDTSTDVVMIISKLS